MLLGAVMDVIELSIHGDIFLIANDLTVQEIEAVEAYSFKRIWLSLMEDAHCVEEREIKAGTKRKNDIVKRLKPTLTPHYFRHNFATLLFEAGVEPLIAMKILGHTDYQETLTASPRWLWYPDTTLRATGLGAGQPRRQMGHCGTATWS